MNLLNKKPNNQGILSATRPASTVLDINYKQNSNGLQTKLHQKKKIVVYLKEQKYFVEHSAAFALGIINTRAIMLDKPKLIEISYDTHNKLSGNGEIEIEYFNLENKKPKLKVYVDNSSYCIDISTAYTLGLLTVEEFNNFESKYYYISELYVPELKKEYDVEIYSLSLKEEINSKKM